MKAGQKCTAVRRIIVPQAYVEDVKVALSARLDKNTIGDPADPTVRMGSLASKIQVERVKENIDLLKAEQNIVYGDPDNFDVIGADKDKGALFHQSYS